MKAQSYRIALTLAATLIGVSPVVSGADVAPPGSGDPARAGKGATIVAESSYGPGQESRRAETGEPAVNPSRAEDGRTNRNSPHPAVQSFERPVYPIGVPNPPVSLERY
jgi:hypothetical protein